MAWPQGFDAQFLTTLDDDLTCPICHLAMREPLLTHCGHHFCTSCLEPLYNRNRVLCPVCRLDLKRKDVYPDNSLKRKVLDVQIKCDQSPEGCEWVGELRRREKHNTQCQYVLEPCPNNCGEKVLKKDMGNHTKLTCHYRLVVCSYCKGAMPHDDLEDHVEVCDLCPISCQLNCGGKIARGMMKDHVGKQGACPNSELTCKFADEGCHFRGVPEELDEHMKDNVTQHLDLVSAELKTAKGERDSVTEELKKVKDHMASVSTQMSKFEYIWKIENWSEIVSDAKSGKKRRLSSPTFYSGHPGYNMRITVYPAGMRTHQSSNVSVYLHLRKGKYDRLLRWPFDNAYSLSVLDQTPNGVDETVRFYPEEFDDAFNSPDGKGFGIHTIAIHEKLAQRHFVTDDSVMIKLTVFK